VHNHFTRDIRAFGSGCPGCDDYWRANMPGAVAAAEENARYEREKAEAELEGILAAANFQHRSGCAIERSGKCICNYIGQWDPK
jgi:hypothetical protein